MPNNDLLTAEQQLENIKPFLRHDPACAASAMKAWINDTSQVCACGLDGKWSKLQSTIQQLRDERQNVELPCGCIMYWQRTRAFCKAHILGLRIPDDAPPEGEK